jgi:hypothetical protein
MRTFRFVSLLSIAACLLVTGCDDSKNPLSDPQTSKADERLVGVWRGRNEDGDLIYYHVGRVSDKLPQGVMWAVCVKHKDGRVEPPGQWLIFPTTLGGKTYLSVTEGTEQRVKLWEEKGWQPKADDYYFVLKYQIDGGKLSLWQMDRDAKERAIKGGKIKGVVERKKNQFVGRIAFTDTTENVARFVAGAGDGLFPKEWLRLERVK